MAQDKICGKVARITIFPVKSMRGQNVEGAFCSFTGLAYGDVLDRRFSVISRKVNSSDFRVVTAREKPKLALIQAMVKDDSLLLCAPEKSSIKVDLPGWDDGSLLNVEIWDHILPAADCGEEVAHWISEFLGKECQLVYHGSAMSKRKCDAGLTKWHKNIKPQDQVAFQDEFPFMLMTTASVEDLNTRVETPVKVDNFRPNILIETSKAFDEDSWSEIKIGDAILRNTKPCQRCTMTTVDPATGKKDPNLQPLKTLRSYRLMEPEFGDAPCFGINLVAEVEGAIRVGQDVLVTYK